MAETDELLRAMLRRLREASRSSGVSLYLPTQRSATAHPFLLHDGSPPAVPELEDLSAAAAFAEQADARPRGPAELSQWVSTPAVRSRGENSFVIRIPSVESFLASVRVSTPGVERRGPAQARDGVRSPDGSAPNDAWLGFRFDQLPEGADLESNDGGELFGVPQACWSALLAMASSLDWHARWESAALNDAVSGLPLRAEFHRILDQVLQHSTGSSRPGLIFVNPDDFATLNDRLGREAGDQVIREIGLRLNQGIRNTDFAFRFGAAVFGVLLPSTSSETIGRVSEKLHRLLCAEAYLNRSVGLDFRLGAAVDEPQGRDNPPDRGTELIRRADRALNTAKSGGDRKCVVWTADDEVSAAAQYDRLSGIYTADPTRDYRNMLLLWDTVGILGSNDDVDSLLVEVLERLSKTFRVARLGFFWHGHEGRTGPGLIRRAEDPETVDRIEAPDFDRSRQVLIDRALPAKHAIAGRLADERTQDAHASSLCGCVLPVGTADRPLGFLLLEWREDHEDVGPADLGFLDALAGQLAMALDRARLVEQERLRQQDEKTRLTDELNALREAMQQSQLVSESGAMDQVLATVRRVAPTDVTVLIHGESGTGKELLARTVHQLSERRDKPLVVVDCGAIATSLIDSELFGHERGAYTGAEQRTTGRLAEADGGTILLDEIGELPLEVQSKILRFVQERQYTRVGSTQPQSVDVRVIAVTHRDLAAEVAAGRFREDLFHRLNVVRLVVPPLRERPEDVALLTRHFLEKFAIQHGKRTRGLSPAAEKIVRAYSWPGNVRELQNRLLRAVVLCEGDEIGVTELGLAEGSAPTGFEARQDGSPPIDPAAPPLSAEESHSSAVEEIRRVLAEQIDAARSDSDFPPPIGKWVGEDLVLEAYRASGETCSRAAALLAIPETTFRRRLQKARAQRVAGLAARPETWAPVLERIAGLVTAGNASGEDLPERLRGELLEEIASRFPRDTKRAAAFLGVSEPTYRSWVGERNSR